MWENAHGAVVSSSESMTNPDLVEAHLVRCLLNLQLSDSSFKRREM